MITEFFSGLGNVGKGVWGAGANVISAVPGAVSGTTNTIFDVADQFGERAGAVVNQAVGVIPALQAAGIIKDETVEAEQRHYQNVIAAEQQHNSDLKLVAFSAAGVAALTVTGLIIAAVMKGKK